MFEGPFTYIKLESGAITAAAGGDTKTKSRHVWRNIQKTRSSKKERPMANRTAAAGQCWRKSNSAYCYRAEDYGWVDTIQPTPTETMYINKFNRDYNYFTGRGGHSMLTDNDKLEINQYALNTPRPTDATGTQFDKYKLRTGFELYVPQTLTTQVVHAQPGLRRQHSITLDDWIDSQEAGGKQTRRRRTRKKRKTRRRRRRKRKKRQTRKKKN